MRLLLLLLPLGLFAEEVILKCEQTRKSTPANPNLPVNKDIKYLVKINIQDRKASFQHDRESLVPDISNYENENLWFEETRNRMTSKKSKHFEYDQDYVSWSYIYTRLDGKKELHVFAMQRLDGFLWHQIHDTFDPNRVDLLSSSKYVAIARMEYACTKAERLF